MPFYKDFNISPALNGFIVRWKWCFDSEHPTEMPNVNLFYVRVNENEIIGESLFEEYDIINYVIHKEHIADKNNPAEGIANFHRATVHKAQEEGIIYAEFSRGGVADAQKLIEVPQGSMYVVCLYDSLDHAEWKTVTAGTEESSQAHITEKSVLFGGGAKILQFGAKNEPDFNRQIIRITVDDNGNKLYSLLPKDEEKLYVNDTLKSEYKYLSFLIHS